MIVYSGTKNETGTRTRHYQSVWWQGSAVHRNELRMCSHGKGKPSDDKGKKERKKKRKETLLFN